MNVTCALQCRAGNVTSFQKVCSGELVPELPTSAAVPSVASIHGRKCPFSTADQLAGMIFTAQSLSIPQSVGQRESPGRQLFQHEFESEGQIWDAIRDAERSVFPSA